MKEKNVLELIKAYQNALEEITNSLVLDGIQVRKDYCDKKIKVKEYHDKTDEYKNKIKCLMFQYMTISNVYCSVLGETKVFYDVEHNPEKETIELLETSISMYKWDLERCSKYRQVHCAIDEQVHETKRLELQLKVNVLNDLKTYLENKMKGSDE